MENSITRSEYESACDCVDAVSGTVTVKRCTEDNAARLFPNEVYLDHLEWINSLNQHEPEGEVSDFVPPLTFQNRVKEVLDLLENDGSFYLSEYRTFIFEEKQIAYVLQHYLGLCWIMTNHVKEAILLKRQRRKNV